MKKFNITGMSCAACQSRIEKAVSKLPGVTECSVSLLTNSMGVEGTASTDQIIKAVGQAGYGASSLTSNTNKTSTESSKTVSAQNLENAEIPILKKRLITSLLFLFILMYVSMGHMMWNWPLPPWFNNNHIAMGLLQMILASIVILINKKFFTSGIKSLIHGSPNMDTLVALGSGVSFIYSTVILFAMTDAVLKNDHLLVMHYMDNFYFEGAAMIVTLITVGKLLEAVSKGKTTDALKSLMKLAPKTATVIRDGKEIEIDISDVVEGDIFTVRPGESIPVDGIVIEGNSAVNESALTGESIPVDKTEGSQVSAATINTSGFLKCKATRVGQDTTLSQIIQMVSDAAATKAPIAKIADKVSGFFVPAVIGIALLTFIIWLITGADFSFALSRGIAVLVVSCPCALGLATPVAIMVGSGQGARNGILFKTSASLEAAGRTQIIALDKTGTITEGKPQVVQIISNDENLLPVAAGLESKSEHPLAKAITDYSDKNKIQAVNIQNFQAIGGKGIKAKTESGEDLFGGNLSFINEYTPDVLSTEILNQINELASKGQTPVLFTKKDSTEAKFLGIISIADIIKPEAHEAITQLKNMGIHVVMLTGDNEITAKTIALQAGVDEVIAEVLPEGKEAVIKTLKQNGKVAMVGDGINDAPALTRADTGIAIGAGTDVAIDAADVVLIKSRLDDVPAAIRLSRKTLTNIHENLFWAFFYNVILIPVAAGVYFTAFGLQMNPMFGAAAMSLSSFCVVTNALRLNFVNIKKATHDKKIKNKLYEKTTKGSMEDNMEKTIKVEGMMCGHCEAHVKEALEKIKGVDTALPNHETGEVKLTLSKDVKDKDFEKAITKAGYKYIS